MTTFAYNELNRSDQDILPLVTETDCREVRPPSATLEGIARPESLLLLACARTQVDSETADHIKSLLREELDWEFILRKAQQHCIAPLLYFNLTNICPELLPAKILDQMRGYLKFHTRFNVLMTGELLKLLRALEDEGIEALPFKGPVLASLAYGNIALRQFADLDILVHKRDALKAKSVLMSRGYELGIPLTLAQKYLPAISRKKDFILVKGDSVRVELHWRLTGGHFSFSLNSRQLWERLDTIEIAGSPVRSLPPSTLLLFLCMHGSRHGWERLGWICDIAEMIRIHKEIDWNAFLKESRTIGSERNMALGLYLAHHLLGAALPQEVLQRVEADTVVVSLAAQIKDRLFRSLETSLDIAHWQEFHLRVRERLRDRIRVRAHYYFRYLHLLTSPTDRERELFSLPEPLSFFYYIIRPLRLAGKYGFGFIKQLFRRSK